MGRILNLFIAFCILPALCLAQKERHIHTTNNFIFDFFIVVDCKSNLDGKEFKFVLCNNGWHHSDDFLKSQDEYKSNVLYYIEKLKRSDKSDTTKVLLSNRQIEMIYELTKDFFILPKHLGTFDTKVMSFSPPYDGLKANIYLDVNSGIKYNITIDSAECNLTLKKFLVCLSEIINKNK